MKLGMLCSSNEGMRYSGIFTMSYFLFMIISCLIYSSKTFYGSFNVGPFILPLVNLPMISEIFELGFKGLVFMHSISKVKRSNLKLTQMDPKVILCFNKQQINLLLEKKKKSLKTRCIWRNGFC